MNAIKGANPILPLHIYTPDVEPRVYGGRVYLYGSNDRFGDDFYCSDQLRAYSAPLGDLGDWTDHGIVFACSDQYRDSHGIPDGVPWPTEGQRLFAPDAIRIGNLHYLFFCLSWGTEGVAVSPSPHGPFTDARQITMDGAPIKDIDPAIFVDDDGQAYYYWSQIGLKAARMNGDLHTLDPATYNPRLIGDEAPFRFHEGASMRKIRGKYHLIYTSTSRGKATTLDWAASDHPLGPFTYGGVIVDSAKLDPESWNNHGSMAEISGEWFVFYHASSNHTRWNRRVRAEKVSFGPDGAILECEPTSQGFRVSLAPTEDTSAARAAELSGGCYLTEQGVDVHPLVNIGDGDFAVYRYFDFGGQARGWRFEATYRPAGGGGRMEIRLDSPEGALAGTAVLDAGPGDGWKTSCAGAGRINGRHAVYLVFRGGEAIGELASFKFL